MSDKKKYKRWAKSSTADGITERTEVEEVENGFIKTVTIEGDKDGEYTYDCKKYISEENPMEETPLLEKLAQALKNVT